MMKKIWIFVIVFALLSIPFITTAPPMPRTVYGLIDIGGNPAPSGINITIYNEDLGLYANTTTTSNSTFVTVVSGNIGDVINASCSYNGQFIYNTTTVQDRLLQYVNISIPASENRNPVTDAGGSYVGRPNESITFDASNSYDPDGDTLHYRWKFDDGNCDCGWSSWKTLPTEMFTYDEIGEFVVNLEVVDGNGGYANDSTSVTISDVSPIADFSYEPTDIKAGDIVQFIDRSTDPQNDIIIWQWSFGDGGTSNMRNPFYVFSIGSYIIELVVTDIAGHFDSITKTIIIGNGGDDGDDDDDDDGNGDDDNGNGGDGNETVNASECLLLNVNTDKIEYAIGEIVDISIETTNLCNQSINVSFPTTQTYDFKIINESDGVIYQWSHNKSFDQAITTIVWSPRETRWNNISWNQIDDNGSVVPIGEYRIAGWLPSLDMTFENETIILIKSEDADDKIYNLTVNVEGTEQSTIQILKDGEKIDEAVGPTATFTLESGVYDIKVLSSEGEKSMTIDLAGDTIKTVDFNSDDTPLGFGVVIAGLVVAILLYKGKRVGNIDCSRRIPHRRMVSRNEHGIRE